MVAGIILRLALAVGVYSLGVNIGALCRHAAQLPHAPLSALGWATFDWLLILVGIWSLGLIGQMLRYRHARRVGPPQVWAWRDGDDPVQLSVLSFGIDPLGCPAWHVCDVMLPPQINIAIDGLTRHAALYLHVDDAVVRLEGRGRMLSVTSPGAL